MKNTVAQNHLRADSALSPDRWTAAMSAELYGVERWGAGYFDISEEGQVRVLVNYPGGRVAVSLMDIVEGMRERGHDMPIVLRIENILSDRIRQMNEAFERAFKKLDYKNIYRGVYPIKVNQQCHVIEEIAEFGSLYHYGFEAGSKAELIIAIAELKDYDSLIICNGYKDREFIELGLYARAVGMSCFFVLETVAELDLLLECSQRLGIEPLIGVRIRTHVNVEGHWRSGSGERSVFGLSATALIDVVGKLKQAGMLHCLQLLHCHLGSQIPNIRNIRTGVLEATRYYRELIGEGAPMGYLDLGGGLAVDYDGSRSNTDHSANYQLDEYCVNIVETIKESLDPLNIPHPVVITESGRATVAYASLLLLEIIDVLEYKSQPLPEELPPDCHEKLYSMVEVLDVVDEANVQECFNDAGYYRDEIRADFLHGQASLRDQGLADNLNLAILERIDQLLPGLDRVPPELSHLPEILSDIYYGNFSVFQSLPDSWAIGQIFPVMPIHRLDEEPVRQGVIADITCDCDGQLDKFTIQNDQTSRLALHPLSKTEDYILGVFLVGAYQETLGDLHNLFGDTQVVSVHIKEDGSFEYVRAFYGDSIADVLSYVEYEPKHLVERFRLKTELAVREERISVARRRQMLEAFSASLQGYTYLVR